MSIELIKNIRYKTGLSLSAIQKAVVTLNSEDEDQIIKYLREQGVLKNEARTGRTAEEGRIFAYVHEGRLGVMLEIKSETDFVSRAENF
jgi:elongation factor Ts